jgi:nicotinamide riboside transporter PnuC
LPARKAESPALRVLAALLGIIGLELVRYFAFRSEYQTDPSLWLVIAGSIAFNIWFQWWTLPDTAWKALIAATLTEAGLPPAARIVVTAVVGLFKALAPLIAPR